MECNSMDFKTPIKVQIKVQLTPSTKQFTCVLCGERKLDRRDRRKLMQGSDKSDVYVLIEKILHIKITEEDHSDICCKTCAGRLVTVNKSLEKFKATYESTRVKLKESHGQKVSKRMSVESQGQSKRKALFVEGSVKTTQLKNSPHEGGGQIDIDDKDFPYDSLIETLMHGERNKIVQEIMSIQELSKGVEEYIFQKLKNEISYLCEKSTDSLLRKCKIDDLMSFSFKEIENEWKEKAPLFYKFLVISSTNTSAEQRNKIKKGDSILQAQVAAGCKLLNVYNQDMKLLQTVNDILFLKGGMKKTGFTRMQSTNDCHSYMTTITLADKLAKDWTIPLNEWKQQVEEDTEHESQMITQLDYIKDTIDMCTGVGDVELPDLILEKASLEKSLHDFRSIMHPGFYFVGDNVDMVTKVRQMTSTSQNKDQHMYQMCVYENRVSGNHLDNIKPIQDAKTAPLAQLIPGEKEKQKMIDDFSFLVAKKWCEYLTYFTPFDAALPEYIHHEYISDTTKCTKRVNMGVLKKNESKNEDMADICKFLHQYVPGNDETSNTVPTKILSGGNYLTFERHKQAQMSVRDDATPSLRLEGLIPKMEEFHNQAELLKVIWSRLYSTASSRDIGTMYAARNITNSRNVTADPTGNYYASSVMMDKFSDAYIVAGALEHFNMESITAEPQANIYTGEIGDPEQMKNFVLGEAKTFVTEYTFLDMSPLPNYGPQCLRLACRYCDKVYKQPMALRKHEHTVHGHIDPHFSDTLTTDRATNSDIPEDKMLNYSKQSLTLCLLRMNHNNALAMGDGNRIMAVNEYLFLLYKASNCPKYAYGLLETICQHKILLSQRMAHRLKWNRTVNHRGKKNSNHPNDLDLEHCNRVFKDEAHSFRGIFTEKTISRVSRSALCTDQIAKNYDKQTNTRKASGIHTEKDLTADVFFIVNQLLQQQVFKSLPGRNHSAFPELSANPFIKLNMENVKDWIFNSLQKFSAKHYY